MWAGFSGIGVPPHDGPAVSFSKHGNAKHGYGKWSHVVGYDQGRPYLQMLTMSDPVAKITPHKVDLCRVVSRCYGFPIGKSLLGMTYNFGVTDHLREQRWRSAGILIYLYSLQCECCACPCPQMRMLSWCCFIRDVHLRTCPPR